MDVCTTPPPNLIVAKAQVFAALALRCVIESDPEHPRAEELRQGSARWLRKAGAWELAVEPLEERVLDAPLRGLSDGELTDCRWAGEHVAMLAWALALGDRPIEWEPVNVTSQTAALGFMRDEGAAVSRSARVRAVEELKACFKRVSVVRWATHVDRLRRGGRMDPRSQDVLTRALQERLSRAGVTASAEDLETGRQEAVRLGPLTGDSAIPGLLVVRQLTAEWLVGARAPFWAT